MIALALFFAYGILMNGWWLAAVSGRPAQRLGLPGSALVPYVPWVALVVYVLAVFAIIKFKVRWRWTSFVAATLLGNFTIMYPLVLLERASARIPLSASMSMESRQALNAKYPHLKWVIAPAHRGGKGVFVRPDDYSPELAAFVTGLVDHQAEKRGSTGH
jgi:hypothetical protein